jgi:hypothetical protein
MVKLNTLNDSSSSEPRKILIQNIVYGVAFFIVAGFILNLFINTGTAEYNIQKYFFVYMIPLILVFALMLNLGRNMKATKMIMKLIAILSMIVFGVYLYATTTSSVSYESLTNYTMLTIIGLFGLAIGYQALIGYMEKLTGWPGFVAQLIFYIPCTLYTIWEYLVEQVSLTPYSIYLFIGFEFLLIVLYALLPDISKQITGQDNAIQLLQNIRYLDEGKQLIANSDTLKIPLTEHNKYRVAGSSEYLTNYCISMWVYINPHSATTKAYNKESEILTYGFTDEHGIEHVKPMIRYYGGGGGHDQLIERDKYVFYFSRYPPTKQYTEKDHTFYDVTLQNQKWNQIVLNYNRNKVDLFINGDLERTFQMKDEMPLYNDLDKITIGEDNGLDGGICNVVYYRHPLTAEQIAFSYNTMSIGSLPIPRTKVDSTIQNNR